MTPRSVAVLYASIKQLKNEGFETTASTCQIFRDKSNKRSVRLV